MKPYAFLFPGQGVQYTGMGKNIYESFPEAKRTFDVADQILGFSISKLCFEGPDDELTKTVNAQIAIFVTSIATLRVLQTLAPDLRPAAVCGLSLGEFSALVACKSLSFEDGVRLVKRRGELMQEAGEENPGGMISIIGLLQNECEAVCRESGIQIANINSPEQIVLSGTKEGVAKAAELAVQKGAKKAIILKVSGAFHSRLMESAKKGLADALKKITVLEPKSVFIPNVTGEPVSDPIEIKTLLHEQLTCTVQWVQTMAVFEKLGIQNGFEMGPGKVLKGLAKRNNTDLAVYAVETESDIQQVLRMMTEVTRCSD